MNNEQKIVWDRVLSYIATSQTIKKMVAVHVPREDVEEFLSFLILQLTERKPEKIVHAYENGYIDWMCLKIINAQSKSRSSRWNKQWRLQPLIVNETEDELLGILPTEPTSLVEIDTAAIYDDGDFDLPDEFQDPLVQMEQDEEDQLYVKQTKEMVKRIKQITKGFSFYSRELWKLHHDKGMTLMEISKKTGINYSSVYHNIRKNQRIVKSQLENEPGLKNFLEKLLNEQASN